MGTEVSLALNNYFSEQEIVLDEGQVNALATLFSFSEAFLNRSEKRSFFSRKKITGQGVYLYGDVGRGKTMLMDALHDQIPHDHKRRVHFHSFMKEVHEFLHHYRQSDNGSDTVDKALPEFVDTVKEQCDIIFFDEFHITDVADAMILSRLFTALLEKGVWVVMTSNWQPDRLYEGGLQRDRILPFIELIKKQMTVTELDGAVDYRKQVLKGHPVYFIDQDDDFNQMVEGVTKGKLKQSVTLKVKGRELSLEETYGDVAVVTFSNLCEGARGAEDYLAIADNYTVIVLKDIPCLTAEMRNEAKRFMILIDILYDAGCLLVASAQAQPDQLYIGHDHAFEFDRTVSRLIEMQSDAYLKNVLDS